MLHAFHLMLREKVQGGMLHVSDISYTVRWWTWLPSILRRDAWLASGLSFYGSSNTVIWIQLHGQRLGVAFRLTCQDLVVPSTYGVTAAG